MKYLSLLLLFSTVAPVALGQLQPSTGGAGGGTSSNFTSAFPSIGTAIGFKDGSGNMQPALVDASNFLKVNCAVGCSGSSFTDNSAFTAGTSAISNIGGVFNDGITSLSSGNSGVVRLTTDRMLFINLGKVGGSAISLGQAAMASSLPVAISSNQSALPVTQSGNWSSRTQDGTGGPITSNSTAISGTTGLDINIRSILNGAPSTPGKLDIKGADGDIFVRQTTGSNLHVNVDSALGNVASGAADSGNPLKIGGVFNSSQPTVTNGQRIDAQSTARGGLIVATGVDTFNVSATLAAGAAVIGAVTQASGPWAVSQSNGPWSINLTQFAGNNVVTGTGVGGSGIPRVTVSNDSAVQLWDNGNVVNVVAPGSGQNSLLTAGSFKEVSFTTTTVQAVASTEVSNFKWVSVHITSQGTSSNVAFQGSNDNVNWLPLTTLSLGALTSNGQTSTGVTGVFHGPLASRYFRLNVTGISAGTTAGVIEFFTSPAAITSFGIGTNSVSGTIASGAADSGNPVKIGGVFHTTQPTVTDGQRVDVQATARGAVIVAPGVDGFAVSAATLPLPANAAQETGGNLASIATNTSAIDADIKANEPRTVNSNLPGQTGVIPVYVMAGPPPISGQAANNPLLYRAATRNYCYQNLSGCNPLR